MPGWVRVGGKDLTVELDCLQSGSRNPRWLEPKGARLVSGSPKLSWGSEWLGKLKNQIRPKQIPGPIADPRDLRWWAGDVDFRKAPQGNVEVAVEAPGLLWSSDLIPLPLYQGVMEESQSKSTSLRFSGFCSSAFFIDCVSWFRCFP